MSVANAYGKALYEAAVDAGFQGTALDQIETELAHFETAVESVREMKTALYSPIATSKEKNELVTELAKRASMSPLTTRFLALMAAKERMSILPGVREAFSEIRLKSEGGVSGKLIAAEPIEPTDVDGLAQAFSKKLGKKVAFNVSVDPALLAGMKVTVGGVTYDGSLRSQLERLRDRFVSGLAE